MKTSTKLLTDRQFEMLTHTIKNGRYNTAVDDANMERLVSLGFMQSLGTVSWAPGEYFGITPAGRDYVASNKTR